MDKKAIQILIGFGNSSVTYQYDERKQHLLPVKDILKGLDGLFKEEDAFINSQISNSVTTIKTNEPEPFRSDKILSSLVKIGMPIELSVRTLETVIEEITDFIGREKTLSTKDIRRIVAESIRRIESVDSFDAEEWSYRYTRKYGHDSRRVEIYNYPKSGQVKVSYAIISKVVKAAFGKIIPKAAVNAIPRAQMDHICEYVIEFVNGCNLYYFDYNTLVNMINELSRQPPHPWLITEETRDLLKDYDSEAVLSNLNKLDKGLTTEEETYCYLEIIHHSTSLILQKYQWFLGTEDFSSFYILNSLLKKYNTLDWKHIIEANHAIQQLERDLVLADYSIPGFQDMLSKIHSVIQKRRYPCEENRILLTQLGQLALELANEKALCNLVDAINEEWSHKTADEILPILYKTLKTLFHGSGCDKLPINDNMFRFVYNDTIEVKQRRIKKQYVIVYVDGNFDFKVLEYLNNRKYSDYVDVILVSSSSSEIDDILTKINIATNNQYWVVPIKKEDMVSIITNENSSKYFYDMLCNYIL